MGETMDCARPAKYRTLPPQAGPRRARARIIGRARGRTIMITRTSSRLGLLLAGTVGTLVVASWPALAQPAPAPSNEPPPPWAQGRPSPDVKLAPVTPPPLAT